jgi:cellulose 1,4-beta-cellobiosidase
MDGDSSETEGETASAEPVSAASSPYEHTGLSNGTTFYFAVVAVVEAGEGDLSDKVSATPHISAPKGVNAQGGDQQVTLTWDEVPGADTYNVYWATTPDVSLGSNQESKVTSSFVHTQRDSNTTYYYAVTAVDESSESVLSDEVSATTSITQEAWIGAPSGVTSPLYGTSVALSGDYAIVGVYI